MLEDNADFVSADIYLMPPGDGRDSDEDTDSEEGSSANHLNATQLLAPAEFRVNYGTSIVNSLETESDSESESDSDEEAEQLDAANLEHITDNDGMNKGLLSGTPPRFEPRWIKTDLKAKQFERKPKKQNFKEPQSPTQMFDAIFDDDVIQLMVNMTNLYAQREKGKHTFRTDVSEMRLFLAMLFLSGYNVLPRRKLYWENSSNVFNEAMSDAMSRNRIEELLSVLHVCDNENLTASDKMAKVRPFYAMINQKCLECFLNEEELSIDESMLPYYGRHSSKQRIVGKPVRMGYKMWVLASSIGYVVQFEPYQGAKTAGSCKSSASKWGLGEHVVLDLLAELPTGVSYHIHFDNFFTSIRMMQYLNSNNIQATGTIRSNRLGKCTIENSKTLEKKQRGYFDQRTDSDNIVTIVGWNDNRCVYVTSNTSGAQPTATVSRWCRKSNTRIKVDQPNVIKLYNKFMGGVDRCDQNVSAYRISIRSKKWWWALFVWIPDMVMQNAWLLYRNTKAPEDDNLDQLAFRRSIVQMYFKRYSPARPTSGRPRGRILPADRRVNMDIRTDHRDHYQSQFVTQKRCGQCHKNTRKGCKKCGVGLHDHCFQLWHNMD